MKQGKYMLRVYIDEHTAYGSASLVFSFSIFRSTNFEDGFFPVHLKFYNLKDKDGYWGSWGAPSLYVDGVSSCNMNDASKLISVLSQKTKYAYSPQSIAFELLEKSNLFHLVYLDLRTGKNVDAIENINLNRWVARRSSGKWIESVLASDKDDAESKIIVSLLNQNRKDDVKDWIESGNTFMENYIFIDKESIWDWNYKDVINWPSIKNQEKDGENV